MAIERLDVVSSSRARTDSFARLLPDAEVRQITPRFTEELMQKPLSREPSEWPMEMAEQKALQDITAVMVLGTINNMADQNLLAEVGSNTEGRHIRVYSDTISIAHNGNPEGKPIVLEKPRDLATWFQDREKGAMALSDKHIEICTGITGIDMKNPDSHPATVLVRIVAKMRPYSMGEVNDIIEKHGAQAILTTAGGISIWNGGTKLYDGDVPLEIYLQTDPLTTPVKVNEIPDWQKLDGEQLKQILYGAIPEAIDSLQGKLDSIAQQNRIIQSMPVTVRQAKSTTETPKNS
jgi:hypothetical protein